jgi:hypothetical protein
MRHSFSNFQQLNGRPLFDYISSRLLDDRGDISIWGKSIINEYQKISNLPFLPRLSWRDERQCIAFGSRIFGKLKKNGKINTHVLMSARDLIRMPAIPTSFSYDLKAYKVFIDALTNKNFYNLDACFSQMLNTLSIVKPRIFVANSTIDPISRLWILAAREYGISKIYCLQHGLYAQEQPEYAQDEDIVDLYIALDENQKMIVSRYINPEKVLVLGTRDRFIWKSPLSPLSVCFVGEDWERYGYLELKQLIISRYRDLASAFSSLGVTSLFYKPHPSENLMYGIDKELITLTNKEIDLPDVYIGFSSSFLRDASACGKLAIQILEPQTKADCFEANGYCLTVNNDVNLIERIFEIIRSDCSVPFVREQQLDDILDMV